METTFPELFDGRISRRGMAGALPDRSLAASATPGEVRLDADRFFPKRTRGFAFAGLLAVLALKLVYVFVLKVNSDEPQHLHVVWAWSTGQLPYRDIFDNHAPLFQLLWSPVLAALGQRADIVECMRLSVLPLYFAILWLTWRIGHTLWSRPVAGTAVAITAVFSPFMIVSTQFRPDDLWTTLWLATVAVLVGGRLDARRGLLAGLLAGATLVVSLKSLPLFATAALAGVLVWIASWRERARLPPLRWRFLATFAAGLTILPAALAAFFIWSGAGAAMLYALFQHNVVGDLGRWEHGDLRFVLMPLTLPFALWMAWRTRPREGDLERWAQRCFVLLAAAGYLVSIYAYWPLFTQQDLLPAAPFLGLAAALLLKRAGAERFPLPRLRRAGVASVVIAELAVMIVGYPPWEGHRGEFRSRLRDVLTLTGAEDYVMDAKGDSIFRRRPVYWVLESITLTRMHDGSVEDDIAARLSATATPVIRPDRLPEADLRFVDRNYLKLGDDLRIAGQRLGQAVRGETVHFLVTVPLEYSAVTPNGPASAVIDGRRCAPGCALGIGVHSLTTEQDGELAIVWTQALRRGVPTQALFHSG